MTMAEEQTKVPVELAPGLLEDYATSEVRAGWVALADEVERQQDGLADLVGRLQTAYGNQNAATSTMYLRVGDVPDDVDEALRRATGFDRLSTAVEAAGLWPAVDARGLTQEEVALEQRVMERMRAEEAPRPPAGQPGDAPRIDLASIVNVEVIFGRALLDEVAAVTADLAARKDDLQPFIARLVAAFKACEEASGRVYPVNGRVPGIAAWRIDVLDGLGAVLDAASGLTQLHDLAREVGIDEVVA